MPRKRREKRIGVADDRTDVAQAPDPSSRLPPPAPTGAIDKPEDRADEPVLSTAGASLSQHLLAQRKGGASGAATSPEGAATGAKEADGGGDGTAGSGGAAGGGGGLGAEAAEDPDFVSMQPYARAVLGGPLVVAVMRFLEAEAAARAQRVSKPWRAAGRDEWLWRRLARLACRVNDDKTVWKAALDAARRQKSWLTVYPTLPRVRSNGCYRLRASYMRTAYRDMWHNPGPMLQCVFHRVFQFRPDGSLLYTLVPGELDHVLGQFQRSKRAETVYGGAYRLDGDLVRALVRMRRGLWARWNLRILGKESTHMTTPFALTDCEKYRDSDGQFRLPPNTRLEVLSLHIISPPKELDPVQRPELLVADAEEEGEIQEKEPELQREAAVRLAQGGADPAPGTGADRASGAEPAAELVPTDATENAAAPTQAAPASGAGGPDPPVASGASGDEEHGSAEAAKAVVSPVAGSVAAGPVCAPPQEVSATPASSGDEPSSQGQSAPESRTAAQASGSPSSPSLRSAAEVQATIESLSLVMPVADSDDYATASAKMAAAAAVAGGHAARASAAEQSALIGPGGSGAAQAGGGGSARGGDGPHRETTRGATDRTPDQPGRTARRQPGSRRGIANDSARGRLGSSSVPSDRRWTGSGSSASGVRPGYAAARGRLARSKRDRAQDRAAATKAQRSARSRQKTADDAASWSWERTQVRVPIESPLWWRGQDDEMRAMVRAQGLDVEDIEGTREIETDGEIFDFVNEDGRVLGLF